MNPDRMAGEKVDRMTLPASSLDRALWGMERVGGPPAEDDEALLGWSLLLESNTSMSSPVDSSNACPSLFAKDAPCDDILWLVLVLVLPELLLLAPAVVLALLLLLDPFPKMIGSISNCMQTYSPPKIMTPAVVPLSAHHKKLLGTCPE